MSHLILYFHEDPETRIGERRGTRWQVPLQAREESSLFVARSQWALSELFIVVLYEKGSTTERAAIGGDYQKGEEEQRQIERERANTESEG